MISYNNRIEKIAENNSDKVASKCFFLSIYLSDAARKPPRCLFFFYLSVGEIFMLTPAAKETDLSSPKSSHIL